MLNAILESLPTAAKVTEKLVARYGPDRLWQVERLSKHIFRAWLNDGEVALATVLEDGSLQIRELEGGNLMSLGKKIPRGPGETAGDVPVKDKHCENICIVARQNENSKGAKGMNSKVIATQVRLPAELHEYIQQEANRLGIAQNAFLVILLAQGRKVWEAGAILRLEGQ